MLNWRRSVGRTGLRQSLIRQRRWQKGIRRRGEQGISRKTIVQGMPVDTGEPVVTTVCYLPLHTGCGCIGHPAFPAPSVVEGQDSRKNSGEPRLENANAYLHVIARSRARASATRRLAMTNEYARHLSAVIVREGGRSSIPETSVIEPKGPGVLDTPLSRGMTACVRCCGRISRTAAEKEDRESFASIITCKLTGGQVSLNAIPRNSGRAGRRQRRAPTSVRDGSSACEHAGIFQLG
jgi:hypothetical protein